LPAGAESPVIQSFWFLERKWICVFENIKWFKETDLTPEVGILEKDDVLLA